jgi:hypothetical protein
MLNLTLLMLSFRDEFAEQAAKRILALKITPHAKLNNTIGVELRGTVFKVDISYSPANCLVSFQLNNISVYSTYTFACEEECLFSVLCDLWSNAVLGRHIQKGGAK